MSERYGDQRGGRERWIAGAGVVLVHAAIGWLLVTGLAPALVRQASESLRLFEVLPVPPPPPARRAPRPAVDPRKSGAAAPANRGARPSEIVAPVRPAIVPPPVIAAPVAGPEVAPASGAALLPGPGTGGGGSGQGTGSGGAGNGQGAGGRGTFARKIAGQIRDGDYPKAAARAGIGGIVWVRYTVTVHGRAQDCRVTRSSGNAELDAVTCRLVTKRFRYRPGTDAAGRPVSSVVEEDHVWVIDGADD
ncbi:energy transducer TonB [Sphingomonas qilianensis]|uniref:TonB family protein n=1 Tax=Sphingomonas qilianensis TaxID=1736690 RepID=A0ABU9XQE5_9SPHN